MTPSELFRILAEKYPSHVVSSICEVETTCRRRGFCEDKQENTVIDFDEVKNDFYQGTRRPSSVDAVCVGKTGKYFCFVELKGWKNYMRFLNKQKVSVEETANGYDLSGKLEDSQRLCVALTGEDSLFAEMPVVFVLVTDVEVESDGSKLFADLMFKLADTSSDTYSKCISAAKQTLDTQVRIDHDYISCKDFDKHISAL